MTFTVKGKRQYLEDGVPVTSVTTFLQQWPKHLEQWSADETAGWMVDHWEELAKLPPSKRFAVGQKARFQSRDKAMARGTEIHKLGEALVAGEPVDVPDELLGPVEAYARWLEAFGVTPVLVERPILNRTAGYAGRPDLLAVLTRLGGESWLLDLKTGKAGFVDQDLQLAAYAFAEVYLDERGVEQKWPRPDRCGIVHIGPDFCRLIPAEVDEATFRIFRYVQQCHEFAARATQAFKDGDPWPFGDPVPEPVERQLEVVR